MPSFARHRHQCIQSLAHATLVYPVSSIWSGRKSCPGSQCPLGTFSPCRSCRLTYRLVVSEVCRHFTTLVFLAVMLLIFCFLFLSRQAVSMSPFFSIEITFDIFVTAFIRQVVISVTTIATLTFGDVFSSVVLLGFVTFLVVFSWNALPSIPIPAQIRSIAPWRLWLHLQYSWQFWLPCWMSVLHHTP